MRQVTVSAANLVDLNKLARSDPDSGANGVTVRSCSHELQTYPVPGPGTSVVPQQHGRAVEIVDHDVDVPVLVEVAKSGSARRAGLRQRLPGGCGDFLERAVPEDRKSTRLNSSHITISYAVFCLKKKTKRDR